MDVVVPITIRFELAAAGRDRHCASDVDFPTASATLSGVGVAYKLVRALGQSYSSTSQVSASYRAFMLSALCYVALGTVADVVPLVGENRVLVHYGLRAFSHTTNPGLRALKEVAGIGDRPLLASDIAFKLAPILNAAGRLGDARRALELLVCRDAGEAAILVRALVATNQTPPYRMNAAAARAQIDEWVARNCDLGR